MKTKTKPLHEGTKQQGSSRITAEANTNNVVDADTNLAVIPPEIAEIHQLHGEVWDFRRKSLDNGIRIGEILTKLKDECGRGKWLPFVEEHLPFCDRTAQVYMGFYRERDALKSAVSADLPMCRALRLMPKARSKRTEPSTTPSRTPLTTLKTKEPQAEDGTLSDLQPAEDAATDTNAPGAVTQKDEPTSDVSTGMNKGKPRHVADQFDFKFPEGSASGEIVPDDDQVSFKFLDGTHVTGWLDGLISTKKLERELKKIANLPASVPRDERLAQQRVFAAGACAINEVGGAEPNDGTLKAIATALAELRNAIVSHKNYRC